jgi:hypothetical protein
VIGILISVFEFLGGPRRRGPHALVDGCLYALVVEALHNEEPGAPLDNRQSLLDLPLHIFAVAHEVLVVVVTPLRHNI